jgi:hypothetical protein
MKRRTFLQRSAALAPILAEFSSPAPTPAQGLQPMALPKPQRQGGKLLMQALNERRTNRNIGEERLSPQTLSNLLWAAFGVNRESGGLRTAPSAMAVREMDIYAFLSEGVYLFDAVAHSLKPVLAGGVQQPLHRSGVPESGPGFRPSACGCEVCGPAAAHGNVTNGRPGWFSAFRADGPRGRSPPPPQSKADI